MAIENPGLLVAESRFLQSLPDHVRDALSRDLEKVVLTRGEVLQPASTPAEFIYFPLDSLVSMVVSVESGSIVEAATVGNDGYVGLSAFLGIAPGDLTAMVQIGGSAYRMKAETLQLHRDAPSLNEALGSFAGKTLATIAQSIACLAFHPVQERLARWLLLVRDGIEKDEFPLTQDFLAVMLGVHRPTVTIAVRLLESAGLIKHRRGLISIIDAEALVEAACECYRASGGSRVGRRD